MIFTDEEARHAYHKAPVLLQVACQVLESYVATHGVQLELVDSEKRGGFWIAAVCITDQMDAEALEDAISSTNKTFTRTDEWHTCQLENDEVGLITVRVTDAADYSGAH